MKGRILSLIGLWLPVVLWAFLIFRFSSGSVPIASNVYWQDFAVKKTGHVLLFGVLAVLLYRAFRGIGMERKRAIIWAIMISTIYGATDEYHQMFTQGREARVRDIFFDFAGASAFSYFIFRFLPNAPKKIKIYFEKLNLI